MDTQSGYLEVSFSLALAFLNVLDENAPSKRKLRKGQRELRQQESAVADFLRLLGKTPLSMQCSRNTHGSNPNPAVYQKHVLRGRHFKSARR